MHASDRRGGVTDVIDLECGLSQVSPLSPILFLLYMSEVAGGSKWKFSYSDDLAILGIAATSALVAEAAQLGADTILAWVERNAVAFGPAKAEVLYFLDLRSCPSDVLSIKIGDVAI